MAQLKDSLVTGDLRVTGNIYGLITSSQQVLDYNDNKLTKFGYSTTAMTSTSWVGSWDASTTGEYRLRAISPQKLRNTMGLGDTTGALPVANGGTGASSFTANSLVASGSTTTAALTTKGIYTLTGAGNLGWDTTANRTKIPDIGCLAYWNGRYNGSSSNLAYCNKGAFGTGATKNISAGTAAPSGGSSGDIYIQYS